LTRLHKRPLERKPFGSYPVCDRNPLFVDQFLEAGEKIAAYLGLSAMYDMTPCEDHLLPNPNTLPVGELYDVSNRPPN
jgi:hypothetical protein